MPAEIKLCTNCGSTNIEVAGDKYMCRGCNVVYRVTEEGTKAVNTDPLSRHEQRLDKVEREIDAMKKGEPTNPVEEQIDEETAEHNELPSQEEIDADIGEEDGFVIW